MSYGPDTYAALSDLMSYSRDRHDMDDADLAARRARQAARPDRPIPPMSAATQRALDGDAAKRSLRTTRLRGAHDYLDQRRERERRRIAAQLEASFSSPLPSEYVVMPELCGFGYVATRASGWEPGEPIGHSFDSEAEALADLHEQLDERNAA